MVYYKQLLITSCIIHFVSHVHVFSIDYMYQYGCILICMICLSALIFISIISIIFVCILILDEYINIVPCMISVSGKQELCICAWLLLMTVGSLQLNYKPCNCL